MEINRIRVIQLEIKVMKQVNIQHQRIKELQEKYLKVFFERLDIEHKQIELLMAFYAVSKGNANISTTLREFSQLLFGYCTDSDKTKKQDTDNKKEKTRKWIIKLKMWQNSNKIQLIKFPLPETTPLKRFKGEERTPLKRFKADEIKCEFVVLRELNQILTNDPKPKMKCVLSKLSAQLKDGINPEISSGLAP
jgi:hypothetical protein